MPNDPGFVPRQRRADVIDAALSGLTASPKTLPAKLFYDEAGCRLFYEITKLPEYYLTRTETAMLATLAPELVPDGMSRAALIEFGGSDETKARYLLDLPGRRFDTYVSIDVAEAALDAMRRRLLGSHPDLRVIPLVADFMQPLRLPPVSGARLGFFPGSTIGNLDPDTAIRFLEGARHSLGPDAMFLLGADLRKSPSNLLPAYKRLGRGHGSVQLEPAGTLEPRGGGQLRPARLPPRGDLERCGKPDRNAPDRAARPRR